MTTPRESRYTVRYQNQEGDRIDICVAAENVTEAIEAARHEVPSLKLYPSSICSVIGGCK